MIDKYGRNITYLRISVTDRCNLRCSYCMPEVGIKIENHEDILTYEEILKVVNASSKLGVNKIRYTGGEPLIRKNIDKLIYETSKIEGIDDISITTNGILLGDMAQNLKKVGLNRVNISLDTLDKEKFKHITRGGNIDRVFDSIYKCLSLGLKPVKINTVLMKGINDIEFKSFLDLVKELPIEVRFIELMPIGEGLKFYNERKLSFSELLKDNTELIEIESQRNSTSKMYRIPQAKGKIGFISPVSCKFCESCNRIRLTSKGIIKPCLHSTEEINIRTYISDEKTLINELKSIIINKPLEHHLSEDGKSESNKMMYQIGG